MYNRTTSTKFPVILLDSLQCESRKPHGPPTSVSWLQPVRKLTYTGILTAPIAGNPLLLAQTLHTHPTCDTKLGSLKVPTPEAEDFVELILLYTYNGDRDSTVVKPLCYKWEGLWFDSGWCHWNFSLTQSFRSHYGPGVDSASNRNEYQEYFLGVKAAGA